MHNRMKDIDVVLYLRSGIFGVIDSLVSTVGLLSGIAVGGTPRHAIIITGIIYAFVEGFSMAVGSFLSETSAEEYETRGDGGWRPVVAGLVMLAAFILSACIPILPYVFLPGAQALTVSIVVSILALFGLGLATARISKVPFLSRAARMAALGGAAIIIGVIVGKFLKVA